MWQILITILTAATLLLPTLGHTATVSAVETDQFVWTEMYTPWRHPGRNPCRNSTECTPAWAASAMYQAGAIPSAVRDEFLAREAAGQRRHEYWIYSGDEIRINTYAKEGLPYVQHYMRADFFDGKPRYAAGHQIYHDGVWYDMVLVAECGNWVLITHATRTQGTAISADPLSYQYAGYGVPTYTGGPFDRGDPNDCPVCPRYPPVDLPMVPPTGDDEPPVIPVPPAWLLLLSALSGLGLYRRYVRIK